MGIDTGGTYTDAVLLAADADGGKVEVVAKNKSLTTRHDLTVGIGNALAGLPRELLQSVNLAALSTTLSTNSVVEGRGAPVAILLPGYNELQVQKSGLAEILERDCIVLLDGGHDAIGGEAAALDLAAARAAIATLHSKVSAFAVSSMFATRNSAHEVALRDLVAEVCGKPVACGHELAANLGAPRRALTAALNARMIPYIQVLIASVEAILTRLNINARLMIVKGDGSLVNVETARRQPVATVLSGPAASVIGACALSGRGDAVVVDMGGTTTDIAVVRAGKPELATDGARIGDWRPMVEAIRVFSVGLGGDSEVVFKGQLALSKRRVVPLALLAHEYPQVLPALRAQAEAAASPRHNRFALRLQRNDALFARLTPAQLRAWDALADGPAELEALAAAEGGRERLRALAAMERMGLVIYSGFTPSDAMHALGKSSHWDGEAAKLAAVIWAKQMRHVYGCGDWRAGDSEAPCKAVFALVVREIAGKLIAAGLNRHGKLGDSTARNLTRLLADMVLEDGDDSGGDADRARLFQVRFAPELPLVAVGGPAHDYFPEVARLLAMQLLLPPHADTANALGAALGEVAQSAAVTVTQPQHGVFYVFHHAAPLRFDALEAALAKAEELARAEAEAAAKAAGARDIVTRIKREDNHVKHDIDGELFVSAKVMATASGRPRLR